MPGFDGAGGKDPACWTRDASGQMKDINDEGRRRWLAARGAGYFTQNPYTRSGHAFPFAT